MNTDTKKTPEEENKDPIRKPYKQPVLEELGDLRTLTLGGSHPAPGDVSGDFNMTPFP